MFDEFEFDKDRFELRRNGEPVPVEPQVFDVLAFLIDHRDRVVSKEELLDGVWGDRFVSESALTSRIKAVRQALGDDGSSQRLVQTIRGRGYRFVASVVEVTDDAAQTSERADATPPADIPSGVVTFLITDIANSTELWAADRAAMTASLQVYDQILNDETTRHAAVVFASKGDARSIAFTRASDAIEVAVALQHTFDSSDWPGPALQVRMAVHIGEADERGAEYFGPVVDLTSRLTSAGHGGQILLTDQVRQAAMIQATDLGVHYLPNTEEPVHIFQLGNSSFPSLRVASRRPTNLPSAPSRLIGRDATLAAVQHALTEHRLVTLTAAGGTGKTRLALAVGKTMLPQRAAGVWFVDLTTVSDDALVPEKIAAGIGLVLSGGDPTTEVIDYLAKLDALLVLDNCEHLVDACAEFLEAFLSRPGESRVLATTREFFDVDGERAIRLPPLEVDGDRSAAVELFLERALMVNSLFSVDNADRSTVAELCRHLDGSPLAIELAAARANVMSPAELLAGLSARFELLRGGRRRRSKRALDETLDWSYQLLSADEQALFRTLGVFVGSFDLDAVVVVGQISKSSALDLMDSLIAKSLVVSERLRDQIRFRLLETTAAYAERALRDGGEVMATSDRHLDHYLQVCAPYNVGLWASALPTSVAADRDNIRASISWAAESDRWADAGILVFSASTVLQTQPEDLMALADSCLAHLTEGAPGSTAGLHWVKIYTGIQYDFAEPKSIAASLARSSDKTLQALATVWQGFFEFHAEDAETSLASCQRALAGMDGVADTVMKHQMLAVAEVIAGWASANLGDHELALQHQTKVQHHLLAHAPETTLLAEALASEGIAHVVLGDPEAALVIADRLDNRDYLYFSGDEVRASALLTLRDLEGARVIIRTHAADSVTGRFSRKANNSLLLLALLAEAERDSARAERLLMSVENARNPLVSLSYELAKRLGISEAFDAAKLQSTAEPQASGRRAIEVLRAEMIRRGWAEESTPAR